MDNYNSLVVSFQRQGSQLRSLEAKASANEVSMGSMQLQIQGLTKMLEAQHLYVKRMDQNLLKVLGEPFLPLDGNQTPLGGEGHSSSLPAPMEEDTHLPADEQEPNPAWEPRDPDNVLPFSTTVQQLKATDLAGHFVYFFDKDAKLGYEKDLKAWKDYNKDNPNPDAKTKKAFKQTKRNLQNKMNRTKKAVRILLYFSPDGFPSPRPKNAQHQRAWRHNLVTTARAAQACLLDTLFPTDPPKSITVEPFHKKQRGEREFLFHAYNSLAEVGGRKEKCAPDNTPKEYLDWFGFRTSLQQHYTTPNDTGQSGRDAQLSEDEDV